MKNISKVKINYLTYFLIILFLFSGYKNNIFCIAIVFIIHELGHIFFCMIFKVNVISIEIYPFGGIIKLNTLINYPIYKSIIIASGGLIFQILLCFVNCIWIKSNMISLYNKLIFTLNILPIFPLDGYKILLNFLYLFFSYYRSLIISYFFSFITLIFVIINTKNMALFMFSIILLIKDVINLSYIFNKFLLERYIYDFNFKKVTYSYNLNYKKMHINKYSYFYKNGWKNEKYFLSKIFDKSS